MAGTINYYYKSNNDIYILIEAAVTEGLAFPTGGLVAGRLGAHFNMTHTFLLLLKSERFWIQQPTIT